MILCVSLDYELMTQSTSYATMPIIIMVYKYMYVHVTSDPVCYLLMVSTLKLCTFGYSVENTLLIE